MAKVCAKCEKPRKAVEYLIPGVEGPVCSTCRRRWKLENVPGFRELNQKSTHDSYLKRRDQIRDRQLQKDYGITLEEYDRMLEGQDSRCAICRREPGPHRQFSVDHDHSTGRIRGILCHVCNTAIGLLGDSRCLALAAADYLLF